jgi:hypothetical protein
MNEAGKMTLARLSPGFSTEQAQEGETYNAVLR